MHIPSLPSFLLLCLNPEPLSTCVCQSPVQMSTYKRATLDDEDPLDSTGDGDGYPNGFQVGLYVCFRVKKEDFRSW